MIFYTFWLSFFFIFANCCELKFTYKSVCNFYDLNTCKDKTFKSCTPTKRTQKELKCPYWACPQVSLVYNVTDLYNIIVNLSSNF